MPMQSPPVPHAAPCPNLLPSLCRLMGRAASHITLECALQTHPQARQLLLLSCLFWCCFRGRTLMLTTATGQPHANPGAATDQPPKAAGGTWPIPLPCTMQVALICEEVAANRWGLKDVVRQVGCMLSPNLV